MNSEFPTEIIYGVYNNEVLTFVPADYARRAVEEIAAWDKATTWGQAAELAQREDTVLWHPVDAEDAADHDSDEPFSVREVGAVNDGDWPPAPPVVALSIVDDEWPVGREAEYLISGPYLDIPLDAEPQLLAEFERRGVIYRRDDALLKRVGWFSDDLG